MSANKSEARTNRKSIGDLPPRTNYIGMDTEGSEHFINAFTGDIWVFAAGQLKQHYDLEQVNQSGDEWVQYVEDKRGWTELNYSTKNGLAGLAEDAAEVLG